jgi:hypothetical protein
MELTLELTPEERLFAAVIRAAIKDALSAKQPQVRYEAIVFLWMVCPCVAERAKLPTSAKSEVLNNM